MSDFQFLSEAENAEFAHRGERSEGPGPAGGRSIHGTCQVAGALAFFKRQPLYERADETGVAAVSCAYSIHHMLIEERGQGYA